MKQNRISFMKTMFVFVFIFFSTFFAKAQDSNNNFLGKVFCGYQGWFNAYGDGSPVERWVHWSGGTYRSNAGFPAPGHLQFEMYPDVTEYASGSLFQTGFANLSNGEASKLFSNYKLDVIDTHFKWMQEAGIDGVAVQRFTTTDGVFVANDNTKLVNVRASAEKYGKTFYVMFDTNSADDVLKNDWLNNCATYTSSSAYAKVNGKPVVCIWGYGFTHRNPDAASCLAIINWFKAQGCYVVGGVPTNWRTCTSDSKPGFEEVYKAFNMISPWTPGRFKWDVEVDAYKTNSLIPDKAYCDTYGMVYQPVVFSGFAWSNWNGGPQNDFPRRVGEFLWRQVVNIKSLGISNMYVAMFDEYDEGTAIMKTADSYLTIPSNQYFLTNSADGTYLSSDFYLRLVGKATRVIKGLDPVTTNVTIPHSIGPVYLRTSFEPGYDALPNWSDSNEPTVTNTNIGTPVCHTVAATPHVGANSLLFQGTDNSATSSYASMRVFDVDIPIASNSKISFWSYPTTAVSRYATIDLVLTDGTKLSATAATDVNGVSMKSSQGFGTVNTWTNRICNIGQWLNGKTIDRVIVSYDHAAETGAFATNFEDIIIYTEGTVTSLPSAATTPVPTNAQTSVAIAPTLSWTAGANATSHNVYFGTTTTPVLVGNQSTTSYSPGTLANNTTYYWRVDEKNASGTTTGTLWSFTTLAGGTNGSTYVSQTVPTTMLPGATGTASITFQNSGTTTWSVANKYFLGSQNPGDNTTWGSNRKYFDAADNIAPGAQKTFTFTFTAPTTPGTYNFQWKILQDGVEWFGNTSANVAINVSAAATTYRIATCGNSITQSNNEHYSYRYNLWKKLLDANIPFDFVGSWNTNYNGNPVWPTYNGKSFDSDNEGHWGVTTQYYVDNMDSWIANYTADIILLHLGTNDVGNTPIATSQANLTNIIAKYRAKNPNLVIFLAKLIPRGGNVPTAYNDMVGQLAVSLNTAQSPVILVDQSTNFDTNVDTWDGTHPNASGEEKMAQKWFSAIYNYLHPSGYVATTGVSFASPTVTISDIGQTTDLSVIVAPTNATIKAVTYTSSNPSVATVNAAGTLISINTGTTTITVTTVDGAKTATCTVNVTTPYGNNVALGKTVTGFSSQFNNLDWAAANVVNNVNNGWASAAGATTGRNEWFTVDLGQTYSVSKMSLKSSPANPTSMMKDFVLYGSNTGAFAGEEFIITQGTIPPVAGNVYYDVTFAPTTARYVKLKGTSSYDVYVIVGDFKLFGTAANLGTGTITRQVWTGITGTTIADLTGNVNYPSSPTSTTTLTSFDAPLNEAEAYGQRVLGYIVPSVTGNYTFYIASDDDGELWLSSNDTPANKTRIAYLNGWVERYTWTGNATQKSATINLVAGQSYYVEALMKEGIGGDNLSVGWITPGSSTISVIPGANLKPYIITNVAVTGVTMTPTTSTLSVGATQQLTATVAPTTATNKAVTYTSSNTAVATVNATGLVTAVASGTASITVTTTDGTKTAQSIITVTQAVTGVTMTPATVSLNIGATQQLTATVAPATATNKAVTYVSSNVAVASVSATGLVTAVSAGTATITVTTTDGAKTAQSIITVTQAVTGVTMTPATVSLNVGSTQQLTATVAPTTATNKAVTYVSSNTAVATVNATGLVTAVASGTATIKVTTTDGAKTTQSIITVTQAVTGVTMTPATVSLNVGSTQQLTATVAPTTATNKAVTYVSSNTVVATVSATGLVTAVSAGTATITVTTTDGAKTAQSIITVTQPVTSVSITPTTATLIVGATQQLTVTVAPANATNKALTYVSSNTAVATVSATGLVTAVSAGTATVTVTTTDGAKTATCVVSVLASAQTPYTGTAIAIPGVIEIENFDNGGEGIAYHDNEAANQGGQRTSEGVDVEVCGEGTLNIGWTNNGEWTEYTINVPVAGLYDIDCRVSSNAGGGSFRLDFNDVDKTGTLAVPNTATWQTYTSVIKKGVYLNAGVQIMKFYTYGGMNIDKIIIRDQSTSVTGVSFASSIATITAGATKQLTATVVPTTATNKAVTYTSSNTAIATVNATGLVTAVSVGTATITVTTIDGAKTATCVVSVLSPNQTPYTGAAIAIPGVIEIENFDNGGEGIAYHDNEATNQGGQRTTDGVDVEVCGEGTLNIGWTNNGEWTKYTINVATSGLYDIDCRVSSNAANGSFRLDFNDVDKTGTLSVPNTAAWQTYTSVTKTGVYLNAGVQVMTFYTYGGMNINKITISAQSTNVSGLSLAPSVNLVNDIFDVESQQESEIINVYPNPNNGTFNVSFANKLGKYNIDFYDISGKIIFNMKSYTGTNLFINKPDLCDGVYLLKVYSEQKSNIQKIIVKH